MVSCPFCSAELKAETLSAGSPIKCPSCGTEIDIDSDEFNLSSGEVHPGEATYTPGSGIPGSESSLTGSSFAHSGYSDSELESDDPSTSGDLPQETLKAAKPESTSIDTPEEPPVEQTMVFGGKYRDDDSDDDLLMLGDEDEPALSDADLDPEDVGSASLDATVDFGHFANLKKGSPSLDDLEATLDQVGKPAPKRLELPPVESGDVGDMTQMVGRQDLLGKQAPPARPDVTLPADSSRADDTSESSLAESSIPGSSGSGSESVGDRTESPSTHRDDSAGGTRDSQTLAFDSERRSDRVGTPEPVSITGLETGRTVPRGPLEEGRGSRSLLPGDSQVVGSESVRLRAFLLAEPDEDGTSIDYAIEGEAGKGGMGVVYKARQQSLNRLVAIKQIKSDLGASDSDCNKFVSEAVITGQLEHPNIAPVHDLGLAADGLPFYAMKFVEGEDWEDSIKKLTEEENLDILIQVAQAIAFAHSKDVIHRDLKPGNVRLGAFGEVLVMDWGLAARLDGAADIQPAGTPIYMPPETALEYLDYAKNRVVGGKRIESSRRRAPAGKYCDIYLLGALLFKIVTRRAPHRGKSTFECLRAAAKNEIVKVKRTSELLDIAYRAMATDPDDRYASATEFIDAIKSYQAHAQSIQIARRASQELRAAEKLREADQQETTEVYACYSRAQHGYLNALELWEDNSKAKRRLRRTLRNFADAAYANGDYDLALTLLDTSTEENDELRASILKAQKSRASRLLWFRRLQGVAACLFVVAIGLLVYSEVLQRKAASAVELAQSAERDKAAAEKAMAGAEEAKLQAEQDKADADKERQLAEVAKTEAEKAKQQADLDKAAAEEQKILAERDKAAAEAAKQIAERAKVEAEQEKIEAEQLAGEAKFDAVFGAVKYELFENGSYAAQQLASKNDQEIVEWAGANSPALLATWNELKDLADWRDEATELVSETQAAGPTLVASVGNAGPTVTVANTANGASELQVFLPGADTPAKRVPIAGATTSVALSADGRFAAVAGDKLTIVDVESGRALAVDADKSPTVVAFHPNKPELLVGGPGNDTSRWTVSANGAKLVESDAAKNHDEAAITAVGYSPDGLQRFSADSSGWIVLRRSRGENSIGGAETYSHKVSAAEARAITAVAMTSDPEGRLAYGCDDGALYEIQGWWPDAGAEGKPITEGSSITRPPEAARVDGGDFLDTEPTRLREMHDGKITSIAYAERDELILSAGGDTLLVQGAPSKGNPGKLKTSRRYHDTNVLSVAAGGDGHALSSDAKGRVVRWLVRVAPDTQVLEPEGGETGVAAIRLTTAGDAKQGIDVADRDGFVHRWADVTAPGDSQTAWVGHADHRGFEAWRLGGDRPLIVTTAPETALVTNSRGDRTPVTVKRVCVWDAQGLLVRSIDVGERTVLSVDADARLVYASTSGRMVDAEDNGPAAAAYSLDTGEFAFPLWRDTARVSALLPLPANGDGQTRLAVGQRDGQVYFWSPSNGREELARSSARKNWRPIRSLAYDPVGDQLYAGDNTGFVTCWSLKSATEPLYEQLETDGSSSVVPIVQLKAMPGGRLLAVQRRRGSLIAPVVLDQQLLQVAPTGLAAYASYDEETDTLVVLQRHENAASTLDEYRLDADRFRLVNSTEADPNLTGVKAYRDGLLTWGAGYAQWRPRQGGQMKVASTVVSRPRTLALVDGDDSLLSVNSVNTIDRWDNNLSPEMQKPLAVGGKTLATCPGPSPSELYLATETDGGARVELWDIQQRRLVRVVAERIPGRATAIAAHEGKVLVGSSDGVVTISAEGRRLASTPIEGGAPTSITISPNGQRAAVATQSGAPTLLSLVDHHAVTLDRNDVTSVAFTPDSERLIAGIDSGRVVLLELTGETEQGRERTRPLLAFPGHTDRVTLLRVDQQGDATTLVSGDASGRVVVRNL